MKKSHTLSYRAWIIIASFFLFLLTGGVALQYLIPYGQETCADLTTTIGETIVHEANLSRSREAKLKETFQTLSDNIRNGEIPLWQAISILIEFQRQHIFIAVHTATLTQNTLQYTSP